MSGLGLSGQKPPHEEIGSSSTAALQNRVPAARPSAVSKPSKGLRDKKKKSGATPAVAAATPAAPSIASTTPKEPLHATIPMILGGYTEVPKPYHEQDDPAHETPDAKRKRAKLAVNDEVKKGIEYFIDTAFGIAGAKGTKVDSFPREMYVEVMAVVARTLIPSLSFMDAQQTVNEDWARDAGTSSAESIDRGRLHKAVFELVDLWTLDISAGEYVAFAKVLASAVVVALARVSLGVVVENESGSPMIELAKVNPGSAAAHAGMVAGGFILSVNSTPTPNNADFKSTIKTYSPGDFITIREMRGSKTAPETEVRVQLGAAGMTMAEFLKHWNIVKSNTPRQGGRQG